MDLQDMESVSNRHDYPTDEENTTTQSVHGIKPNAASDESHPTNVKPAKTYAHTSDQDISRYKDDCEMTVHRQENSLHTFRVWYDELAAIEPQIKPSSIERNVINTVNDYTWKPWAPEASFTSVGKVIGHLKDVFLMMKRRSPITTARSTLHKKIGFSSWNDSFPQRLCHWI